MLYTTRIYSDIDNNGTNTFTNAKHSTNTNETLSYKNTSLILFSKKGPQFAVR